MDRHEMNWTLAYLEPAEFPGALRLLDVMEDVKWIAHDEAAAWRERIEAWMRFRGPKDVRPDPPKILLVDCPDPFLG